VFFGGCAVFMNVAVLVLMMMRMTVEPSSYAVLMGKVMLVLMMVVVFLAIVMLVVVVADLLMHVGRPLAYSHPKAHSTDNRQGRQYNAADKNRHMKFGHKDDVEHAKMVEQNLHDPQSPAKADRAKLLQVISILLFVGIDVTHESLSRMSTRTSGLVQFPTGCPPHVPGEAISAVNPKPSRTR
jgi:uncharacterized membrane protein